MLSLPEPHASQRMFTYEELDRREASARAILKETGFAKYEGQWDSASCQKALDRALSCCTGPKGGGKRAQRAIVCLERIGHIRQILFEMADSRIDEVLHHALSIGALSEDLLTHAEHDKFMMPRQRLKGVVAAAAAKVASGTKQRAAWRLEAARVRAERPKASAKRIAEMVAEVFGDNAETVRKALRRPPLHV